MHCVAVDQAFGSVAEMSDDHIGPSSAKISNVKNHATSCSVRVRPHGRLRTAAPKVSIRPPAPQAVSTAAAVHNFPRFQHSAHALDQILRASAMLAQPAAMSSPDRVFSSRCTHLAPARVFPNPRPAIISHTRHPSSPSLEAGPMSPQTPQTMRRASGGRPASSSRDVPRLLRARVLQQLEQPPRELQVHVPAATFRRS